MVSTHRDRLARPAPMAATLPNLPTLSDMTAGPWRPASGVTTIGRVGVGAEHGGGPRAVGPATTDRELAARLMAGDADALAEAYRLYGGLVFGVCRRVLRDEGLAEDVTQEVFVLLWQSPERFDPTRGALRTWLGLLAHRRSIDRVRTDTRRAQRETRCDPPVCLGTEVEVDNYLVAAWLSDRVRDALSKLPAEQRQAVVLAYYGGRSYREVAVELSIPEGTAKSRLRQALATLNALLRSELTDQDTPAWI
jgi:RNA polymerase sigma factor (sigma-70 family)